MCHRYEQCGCLFATLVCLGLCSCVCVCFIVVPVYVCKQGMLHTIAASTLVGYFVHAGVKLDKLEQQEAEKLKSE